MTTKLTEDQKKIAKLLASFVRNDMEEFHVKNLSDSQIKELNPIIRNAIATGLHALENIPVNEKAQKSVNLHYSCIPEYWEDPELLEDYLNFLR